MGSPGPAWAAGVALTTPSDEYLRNAWPCAIEGAGRYPEGMRMSPGEADRSSLTGVWQGLYTYPRINRSVSFVATLIESPGALTGSTHEPCVFRDGANGTLFANLFGSRHGRSITFLKTYEAAGPNYGTVDYDGTLSADAVEIAGRWIIRGAWSGTFLMIRETGTRAARTRRARERA